MIKLELSEQMLLTIGKALEQAPWHIANPVINEINRQIIENKKEEEECK